MKTSGASIDPCRGNRRAVLIGALSVPAAALLAVTASRFGPLSWHMAVHIACMNVLAPLAAAMLASQPVGQLRLWSSLPALWVATFAQIVVLWAWHSPSVHLALHAVPGAVATAHALLLLAALMFWLAIVNSLHRWQAMLGLLLSGKLACLLGVLLTFAPRPLFASATHASHGAAEAMLGDQHLAGLLMIAACPLSYVLTAIVLAVQAVNGLEREHALSPSGASAGR
jgi:putative membrane protein